MILRSLMVPKTMLSVMTNVQVALNTLKPLTGAPVVVSLNREPHRDTNFLVPSGVKSAIVVSPWPPGTWLGASREDLDGDGYRCKGPFMGGAAGNLSNGSGMLQSSWMPSDLKPESVRMILDRSDPGRLNVYYDVEVDSEWQHLGRAFDVQNDWLVAKGNTAGEDWFPVLRIPSEAINANKDMILNISAVHATDDMIVPNRPPTATIGDKWLLSKFFTGPELGEPPRSAAPITLHISPEHGIFSFMVGNTFNGNISGLETISNSACPSSGHHLKVTFDPKIMSTKMMIAPGKFSQEELRLPERLPEIKEIYYDAVTHSLLLKGTELEMEFKRQPIPTVKV